MSEPRSSLPPATLHLDEPPEDKRRVNGHTAEAHQRPTPLTRAFERALGAAPGALPSALPGALWGKALIGPARDFLQRPGKDFRARLVALCWALGGGDPGKLPDELPLLVEILHAGSLIIDDVQDDSAARRGAPALHRVCGVPLAINTGNWMYFWAFDLLGRAPLGAATRLALYRRLGRTLMRCHEGQALDLTVRVADLEQPLVPGVVASITRLKTGSLMGFCGYVGARAARAGALLVRRVARCCRDVGVGLQMLDDLGGITARARADKGLEDLRHRRATWPWAWLAEVAEPRAFAEAQRRLCVAEDERDLRAVAELLRERVEATGRIRVARHLGGALAALRDAVGGAPPVIELEREIELLKQSYG
ncbi:polyprenyl synthetase family protein [Sorangium sp. So ce176]|uniref:polyprenyl synthetase family protein n=1 Tax=Sorangium sp. So ce176 TaxID=3133286 RepID=UPI003F6431D8